MQRTARDARDGALLMLGCAVLWSSAGFFFKLIPWNPLVIAGGRSAVAAVFILVYIRVRNLPLRVNGKAWAVAVSMACCFFLFISANKATTAANAIVLQYSAPVFILLLNAALFGKRIRFADAAVTAATMAGVTLCFLDRMDAGGMLGNGLALASGLFFGGVFVTTGRADPAERMAGILLGHVLTAAAGLPFALVFDTPVSAMPVLCILTLGVFQIGIPYLLLGAAAGKCAPLAACLIGVIEPILNPVWVMLIDGETPGILAILGGAAVLGAVTFYSVWDAKRSGAQTATAPL